MKKRMAIMLGSMLLIIAALAFVKFRQISAAIASGSSWQPPPEAITTVVARSEPWSQSLQAIGTVNAVHGVTVSADLPGVVTSIAFESGRAVRQGQVLVRLDTRQERAQLASAEAQRDLVKLNLERSKKLVESGAIAQAEHDRMVMESRQAEARVGEIRATIERKTVRAPFTGVAGIRQVDVGQYLAPGDPIVPVQAYDPIYVNFSVPQQDVAALRVGAVVEVAADSVAETRASGRIHAINSLVDVSTRNVEVQAKVPNPRGRLRPGMFVDVQVSTGANRAVVALPASAILYAPYGNSVFIVAEQKGPKGNTYRGVRQQFVKLGGARGDQVAVVTGVAPGDTVATTGVFKLRNGVAVMVNNKVQPSNSPAPRPEDS